MRDDFEMPGNDTFRNVIRNEINENISDDCRLMREYVEIETIEHVASVDCEGRVFSSCLYGLM